MGGLFSLSRYEEAIEFFRRAIAAIPERRYAHLMLAAALAFSDHDAEAREALQRYLALPLVPKTVAACKAHPMSLAPTGSKFRRA